MKKRPHITPSYRPLTFSSIVRIFGTIELRLEGEGLKDRWLGGLENGNQKLTRKWDGFPSGGKRPVRDRSGIMASRPAWLYLRFDMKDRLAEAELARIERGSSAQTFLKGIQMNKLRGKVAIVTGASKGIGAAIAKSLAAEGASVVVNYASSKSGADAVVSAITAAGGKAVAVRGDVSKAVDAREIVNAAIEKYGRLDILVNNSGVYEFASIEEVTEENFHRIFDVNVLGTLLTTQAAVKHLGEGASIINIGSGASRITPAQTAVYTGTKGALDAITGVLARELGPRKIRVNSINPGMVDTEGARSGGFIGSDFEKALVAQTPLGRIGQVADIAPVAVFLASDDSAWLTGELILASGGLR
jgi:3-oxoacyl-[acyl-carrier protein] reductase